MALNEADGGHREHGCVEAQNHEYWDVEEVLGGLGKLILYIIDKKDK